MRILITGGHLTPALAFIEYIKESKKKDTILFVGRLYSKQKQQQESQEKKEVSKHGVQFIPFQSVKLTKNTFLSKLVSIPGLLTATIKAVSIIAQHKPEVFVSFGGYLAIPVALASWVMRVPIITHEQTRTVGVANKIISKFANKIAVSYTENIAEFPKTRTVLTGNLIRKSVLSANKSLPKWLKKEPTKPVLYITGGSQGSEIINRTVSQILKPLLKNWFVIHQCGKPVGKRNYKKELTKIKQKLSASNQNAYHIREWINEDELSWIYTTATGIISRAGANTTEEIALRGIPSILIPLPFSHNEEQLKNALALSDKKQAILLEQKNLTPEVLLEATELLKKYNRKFRRNLQLFAQTQNPEKKLYDLTQSVVSKK